MEPFYHALKVASTACIGCTHCMSLCPTQAISRQDLTVILYRYACLAGIADAAQSENVLSGFADAGTVSDYARAALLWRFVSQYSLA